ncbi:MAG TPA: type I-F CRISPR-associated protein Csy2 [Aquimonas sp.]|nr:type I-F CRISPR-associated protein Csy2 [Aquimonas sp.]
MSALLLRNLRVAEANLINSGFLVGGPAVLPAMMFAHALGRSLGGNPPTGVAYIHHDRQIKGERVYGVMHPQQRRSATYVFESGKSKDYASSAKGPTLSLQPVANGNLRLSLLIEFNRPVDAPDEVRHFVSQARLAGGRIEHCDAPQVFPDLDDALDTIESGFLVLDRSDLMPRPSDGDPMAALVQHLGQRSDDPQKSWLSATHVGYAPITAIVPRAGAREGYTHAYAEPIVGLVQYRSLRQFTDRATHALWRPQWTPEGVFLLQQSH